MDVFYKIDYQKIWTSKKLEIEQDNNDHKIKQFYRRINNQTTKPKPLTKELKNNDDHTEYKQKK